MPFVLDASIAIAWALPEESPSAELALARMQTDRAVVPSLWWFELRNGLVVNERRTRITEPQTALFLRRIARLAITIDQSPDEAAVLSLARRHRLTVYDATYLELALRAELLLATLDAALARAAGAEGVRLVGD